MNRKESKESPVTILISLWLVVLCTMVFSYSARCIDRYHGINRTPTQQSP